MSRRLALPSFMLASTLTVYAAGQGTEQAPDNAGLAAPEASEPVPAEPESESPNVAVPDEATANQADAPADPPTQLGPPPSSEQDAEDGPDEPQVPMTPPAPDPLTGHFTLGASAVLEFPTGRLGSDLSRGGQLGSGWGLALDAGLGIARPTVLGAWGEFASYSAGKHCEGCESKGLGVGLFVRYHLVQGLRFDPWLAYGAGFAQLSIDDHGTTKDFTGLTWARFELGGDWYALPNLGLGPTLTFSSGGYFKRPDMAGDLASFWDVSLGLRLTLDVPGHRP